MRALVTGSRGFVGTWLRAHLGAVGDEVVELPADLDVTDRAAIGAWMRTHGAEIEACYHLAAQASVARSFEDPGHTWLTNALGTQFLVEALSEAAPAATLLVVSSSEVYGAPAPDELPVDEDAPLRPTSPYAASKVGAEAAGLEGAWGRGLRVVIARPFNHIGPGQSEAFVIPSLVRRVVEAHRNGERVIRVGNLAARRDFSDVRDVVAAYRALVVDGHDRGVYNVCSGQAYAISEVLELIVRAADASLEVVVDPALLRPVDVPVIVGNPARLVAHTGVHFHHSLEATIEELVTSALRGPTARGGVVDR